MQVIISNHYCHNIVNAKKYGYRRSMEMSLPLARAFHCYGETFSPTNKIFLDIKLRPGSVELCFIEANFYLTCERYWLFLKIFLKIFWTKGALGISRGQMSNCIGTLINIGTHTQLDIYRVVTVWYAYTRNPRQIYELNRRTGYPTENWCICYWCILLHSLLFAYDMRAILKKCMHITL